MPEPQPAKPLHPLCHEHHLEMQMTKIFIKMEGARTSAYRCPEADCPVRYSISNGYFLCATGEEVALDMMPRVKCRRDGQPMFLAETNPQKTAFRLWRCPQCDSTRTNEEDLVTNISLQR